MFDEAKAGMIDNLKKEIARLEWEEQLLRKRDDRLRWEEEMLQMEDGLKVRGGLLIDKMPPGTVGSTHSDQISKASSTTVVQMPDEVSLELGSTYLLFDQSIEKSTRLFKAEMDKGLKGLYITRGNPNQVRKLYDLGEARVCWLTSVRASDGMMTVSGLQELSILVSNFIDENNNSVILLDGLEYLVSNNDFPIVLRLLQQIRDKVSTSESKMLIPINPDALDGRQLTLLERECHTIK
ncbi:MAG: DUF835 domain-containing protein [Candidatus Altiarchaeota archaeon]